MATKIGEATTKIKVDQVPVAVTINNRDLLAVTITNNREHQTNNSKVEAVVNNLGPQQVRLTKIKGDLILINRALPATTNNQELINKREEAVPSSQVAQAPVVIRTKVDLINKALAAATINNQDHQTNKLLEVVSNLELHHLAKKALVTTISSQEELALGLVNKEHPVLAIIKISSLGLLLINKVLAQTIINKLVDKALQVPINNRLLQAPTIKASLLQAPVLTSPDQVLTNNKVEATNHHLESNTKLNLVKY